MTSNLQVPYRQVRALYDDETITVYQAYSKEIAETAVSNQKLNASPLFKCTRMTWVKPSWAWMMYRAGYSYKDAGQARILALKMRHEDFQNLLKRGKLTIHENGARDRTAADHQDGTAVNIQWDPERSPSMDKLAYRSIQIGIPASHIKHWAENEIIAIEDVTEKAKELKAAVDKDHDISLETMISEGLVPEERPYDLPMDIQRSLEMI